MGFTLFNPTYNFKADSPVGCAISNFFQCPMPNAQCPMPNSQCPIPSFLQS
ncbi:MAG: hypothetical protein F6J93_24310 [Oscillatoria sp. SIO1A7]|nr:hypothetical protein [Oscillatoria sp. SIO1A7]